MERPFRLSIVVPMYNEAEVLAMFFAGICPILAGQTSDYEIICVDDGSRDGTLALLSDYHAQNARIKIVSLSRNFGKEAALTAGLDSATGDAIIPIDADLQDPPDLIPALVAKWREGYDMVLAVRQSRDCDSVIKRVTAKLFYEVVGRLCDTPIPANAGDFRLMDKCVIEAMRQLPERTRFTKGLFGWLGFRQATVPYTRPARAAGETKWKYWRLWNYALDGIFSFSTLPLRIWTYIGLLVSAASLLYMSWIIIRTLVVGVEVPGYASLFVAVLFFSGLNMVGMGILGEYLGRVFIEVKRRPIYLISERLGFEHD